MRRCKALRERRDRRTCTLGFFVTRSLADRCAHEREPFCELSHRRGVLSQVAGEMSKSQVLWSIVAAARVNAIRRRLQEPVLRIDQHDPSAEIANKWADLQK